MTAATTDGYDVELRGVTKSYGSVRALDDVSISIRRGEFYALLGPSGCGKTTTLRIVAGFERPDHGHVVIGGRDVSALPPYRRAVNTVFQHYALFPHMSVAQNVAFGLEEKRIERTEIGRRVTEALDMVRMSGLGERRPSALSGGQQQRVALARALVNRPTVLLLDEPLGALDLKLRKEMQVELKELHHRLGTTFVFVTHDQDEALTMADRIAVMRDGRVLQEGTPGDVYDHPATRFVAGFIGMTNFLDGEVVERRNGQVLVRTDHSLAVWCASPLAPRSGDAVTVAVRPEKIEVLGDGGEDVNCWGGRVLAGTFLGEQTEYRIQLDGGTEVLVRRQNVALNGANHAVAPGAHVYVRWSPDVSLLLPRATD